MKLLAIIPARSGSKRVANKNIKLLHGKPLIAWTILAALEANIEMDVIVSTDCARIADIAKQWGAQTPFLRPQDLSGDTANVFDAIDFTIQQFNQMGKVYDHVILLQPSSPLRTAQDISDAVQFFHTKKAKSLISVSPFSVPLPWCMPLDEQFSLTHYIQDPTSQFNSRSQDIPSYYHLNGAIYLAEIKALLKHKTFYLPNDAVYAFPMSRQNGIDIDTLEDFELAEFYMQKRSITPQLESA